MSCGVPRAGDDPPSKQRGWHHSAQVVVWYEANDLSCATFGIAYYHYRAPFEKQPVVDRLQWTRQR
jgi:hypothetical protein